MGNGERFRDRSRGKLLWCPAVGWLAWDSWRWSRDAAEEAVRIAAHRTVRAIRNEAIAAKRERLAKLAKSLEGFARKSEATNRVNSLEREARPYMHVPIGDLDGDRFLINVRNGTIIIRRNDEGDCVSFKPHNPDDLDPQKLRAGRLRSDGDLPGL